MSVSGTQSGSFERKSLNCQCSLAQGTRKGRKAGKAGGVTLRTGSGWRASYRQHESERGQFKGQRATGLPDSSSRDEHEYRVDFMPQICLCLSVLFSPHANQTGP